MKTTILATLCLTALFTLTPTAASAAPYTISTDGLEVTDTATGLIWRRCVEGMVFVGVCTGTASTFTHEAALQRAAAQASSTAVAWRLPNIKELSSIADISLQNPAIDAAAFPATPAANFWSASPFVVIPADAWTVSFLNGYVFTDLRSNRFYVRLVRASQ